MLREKKRINSKPQLYIVQFRQVDFVENHLSVLKSPVLKIQCLADNVSELFGTFSDKMKEVLQPDVATCTLTPLTNEEHCQYRYTQTGFWKTEEIP